MSIMGLRDASASKNSLNKPSLLFCIFVRTLPVRRVRYEEYNVVVVDGANDRNQRLQNPHLEQQVVLEPKPTRVVLPKTKPLIVPIIYLYTFTWNHWQFPKPRMLSSCRARSFSDKFPSDEAITFASLEEPVMRPANRLLTHHWDPFSRSCASLWSTRETGKDRDQHVLSCLRWSHSTKRVGQSQTQTTSWTNCPDAIQMFERTFNCLKLSNQTVNSVMGLLSWNRTFAQSLSQPTWLPGRGSLL